MNISNNLILSLQNKFKYIGTKYLSLGLSRLIKLINLRLDLE